MSGIRVVAALAVFLACVYTSYQLPRGPDKHQNCRDACKQKPLDIAFVIDASSSIWAVNFTLGLWFVEDFLDIFEIGPQSVRVAVVTYGDRVYIDDSFGLDTYSNRVDLKAAISHLPYRAGNATETGAGIKHMSDVILPKARAGVTTACIVLTDGNSQRGDVTAEEAQKARENGLQMFAIGVGHNVSEDELRNIAGVDDHVLMVTSYNLLGTIRSRLAFETCGEEPVPRVVCRDNPMDISFVIDASSSIGQANFTIGLAFVKNFVESFDVGPNHTRFSVITYGRGTYDYTAFDFDSYNEEVNVINAISQISYAAGDHTDTGLGIEFMRERQMTPKKRSEAAHIAIVMTDGRSQDWEKTEDEAAESRDKGISMFAIGVGPNLSRNELRKIAGVPDRVFTVDDYNALDSIKQQLDDKTCEIALGRFHSDLRQR